MLKSVINPDLSRRKIVLVLFVLVSVSSLLAQMPSLWENIRNSAYTQEDSIVIRCETASNVAVETQMYYSVEGGWELGNLQNIAGITYQAKAAFDNQHATFIRYRSIVDTFVTMMPAYFPESGATHSYSKLGFVANDPSGDTIQGNDYLDLTGEAFGYSDDKLYVGMTNIAGDFPTDSGGYVPSEFYLYIGGLLNPETVWQDSVFYALVYANIPIFAEPGLYKISGISFSMDSINKIADIEYDISDGALVMSCNISDLVNDPDFGDWPNISNSLGFNSFTVASGISGVVSMGDYCKSSIQKIEKYVIEPFENHLPELSDANAGTGVSNTIVNVGYFDEDANFPLVSEVVSYNLDGTQETYQLVPAGFDFTSQVNFAAQIPETEWDYLIVRFSDNGSDFVGDTIYDSNADDNVISSQNSVSVYPNPFILNNIKSSVTISYDVKSYQNSTIEIFNIKGEKIAELAGNNTGKTVWSANVKSGIYLYKIASQNNNYSGKITVIK